MPTIFSATPSMDTGVLTPRIGTGSAAVAQGPELDPVEQEQLSQKLFNIEYSENRGIPWYRGLAETAAGTLIDLGDTLASSVPNPGKLFGAGPERGDVWNLVGDYGGPIGRELQDYYNRNQGRIELLSGITGAVGTGYMAGEMLLPRISSALANSTAISGSRLWQAGAAANAATRAEMIAAQASAAADGQAFRMFANPAGRAYIANKVLRGVGKAAFEEAAIGATMNQNHAVWSDDVSTNLLFASLGLGIGGTVAGFGARAEIRQLANDPAMVALRRDAVDPQGFSSLRENTPQGAAFQLLQNPALKAKESANFTSLMLEGRQSTPTNASPALASKFEGIRDNATKQAYDSFQKISRQGVPGVASSKFSIDSGSEARAHITETAHEDPTFMFGAASVGLARANRIDQTISPLGSLMKDRDELVDNLLTSPSPADIRLGRQLKNQQALYLVNKSWLNARDPMANEFSRYQPGQIQLRQIAPTVAEYSFTSGTNRNIRIGDRFTVIRGTGRAAFQDMPLTDQLQTLEATRELFKRMKAMGAAHQVPTNADWYQLDSAVEFEKAGGHVIWGNGGIQNATDAQVQSLKLKADDILSKNRNMGDYWTRLQYNLPLPTSVERIYDSAGNTMKSILLAAQQGAGLDALKAMRERLMNASGFDIRGAESSLDGGFFRFNLDQKNKWFTPVVGFFDNAVINRPLNAATVASANAELKVAKIMTLTAQKQGVPPGIVPEMVNRVIASPDFQNSLRIGGLADDQITGLRNFFSQAAGEMLTREMRYRDNPTMLALLRTRELVNRISDEYIYSLSSKLTPHVKRLNAAPNGASKTLVNQFYSNASGWDIESMQPHGAGNNTYGFILAPTERNAQRLGRPVLQNEYLVNPRNNNVIVVDRVGADFIGEFQAVADNLREDINRIRSARGLTPIARKKFYVPPPETRGRFVGFTFDEDNNLVPGGAIITRTEEEFNRLKAAKHNEIASNPSMKGYTFRTREEIARSNDLYDRAAMDWIDPGYGYRPARGQAGTLASDVVNPNAVQDVLHWIARQGEQIGTDMMRVLYESQLGIARARSAVERSGVGLKPESPLRTIWDEYEATALGWKLSDTQHSLSGIPMKWIEDRVNKGIAASWPAMKWMAPSHLATWISDLAQRVGLPSNKLGSAKTFTKLTQELGPYMPYKDATDYAEQTLKVIRPPEIKQISQKLNQLTAALTLRAFEIVGMPALNMLGIITTLPSIVQTGRAPLMTTFNVGTRRVGVVDAYKYLAQGFKDMLSQTSHPDWNFMVKNGDTTQQVADFNKQMSSIVDQGTFHRVMMGDKSIKVKHVVNFKSLQDATDYVKHKGIDGLIGIATDTTENWSRTWAHFVGLRLADHHGITGLEARHNFARDIANAAIANYNPLNRPELYQSAFGSMFGLFMSYMQSYNQRLFRWMEQGDYAAIGNQMAMQSALFGIASVPGFNNIQHALQFFGQGKTQDGHDSTLIDQIYARFGPEIGSAIAHGSLTQLGIALYTRGDMNYREPTLDPTKFVAGIGLLSSVATAVREAAETMFDPNSLEQNHRLAEIVARNMPNRVMKGLLEVIADGGHSVDARGQIVTENRNFYEAALRAVGLRSTYQQGRIEAFYTNKQLMEREAARMDVLRNETRSLIRNNPKWQDSIQDVFNRYLQSGGRPEHFRTWVKDQIQSATNRRDINDLVKALRNPSNQLAVWRYGAYAPD